MQLALKRCKQFVKLPPREFTDLKPTYSFELGGEKKTKGAALTFVRPAVLLLPCLLLISSSNGLHVTPGRIRCTIQYCLSC